MKFLTQADLPNNWDALLPNCKFYKYKNNYSPVFCLYQGENHEDCFILVAREAYCMICRGESNSFLGERVARRAINDMLYSLVFDSEQLEQVTFESLDGGIKEDFKGIHIDQNPNDEEGREKTINLIFTHWDKDANLIDGSHVQLP